MDEFVEKLAANIDAAGLFEAGAPVLVGVSGGADSMALLAALRRLAARPNRGYKITAAHLNHRLRPDAGDDEEFTATVAEKWGIRCITARRDVKKYADRHGLGVEEAARRQRYDFLLAAARDASARYVALGHHGDDNVETILYHVIRGTHVRGLAGIPATRPLGQGIVLVRPMLNCRRSEIEDFCRREKIPWRTDPTNADVSFSRNFIRNELLPLVRGRLNPRVDGALLSLGAAADKLSRLLDRLARGAYHDALHKTAPGRIVLSAEALAGHAEVVRCEVLRVALQDLGAPLGKVTAEHYVRFAALTGGGAVALPGGWVARSEGAEIIISRTRGDDSRPVAPMDLVCPGRTVLDDGRIVLCDVGPIDRRAFKEHLDDHAAGVEYIDADRIAGRLVARTRRSADRFVPLGAPGSVSVSDFLTNLKLPRRRRGRVLCVCDEGGIVYLAPLRIAERVKVTPDTRRVVRIALMRPVGGGESLDEQEPVG